MPANLIGRYAFRFTGFDNNHPYLYHIAGLGWLEINADPADAARFTIKGDQRFSKVLMSNTSSPLKMSQNGYALTGHCTPGPDDGFGSATMNFQLNDSTAFIGQYLMQRVDNNRFWLISNGLSNHDLSKTFAEVTSIEVVRKG